MRSGRPRQLPVKAGGNSNIWAWSLNRGPGAAMATCQELRRRAAMQSLGLWRPEVQNEGVSRASSLWGVRGSSPPAPPSFWGLQSPSACGRIPPASAPPSLVHTRRSLSLRPPLFSLFKKTFIHLFSCTRSLLQQCGIQFPDQESNPGLPALRVSSLNHWTTRESPLSFLL